MNIFRWASPLKNLLVPDQRAFRRVWLGPASGFELPLNPQTDLWIMLGLLEPELKGDLREMVRPGDTCYDVGSSIGYYTLACSKLAGEADLVAIEGDPGRYETLQEVLERNDLGPTRVHTRRALVVDQAQGDQRVTIDGLVEEGLPAPDFIKMDIEGGEAAALEGAEATLAEVRPRMIIEVHGREVGEACRKLLEAHDYDLERRDQDTRIYRSDPNPDRFWYLCRPR